MKLDFLADSRWLNEERVVNYSRIFVVAYIAAIALCLGLSHGLIDANGKPIGTDFMDVWAAGKLALAGEPSAAYDYCAAFRGSASGSTVARRPRRALFRLALSTSVPTCRGGAGAASLWRCFGHMDGGDLARLSRCDARYYPEQTMVASCVGVSRCVRKPRPWPERISFHGPAWRRALAFGISSGGSRHLFPRFYRISRNSVFSCLLL